MEMPKNFENTKASGSFTRCEVGGHKATVMQVKEATNKNGGQMIIVAIDFDGNDKQPFYFQEMFKADDREGKKWPNQGTQYINVLDFEGNCSRSFKSFCTCVEESNPGFQIKWGVDFAPQLKGKRIGVVYGIVEEFYNNKTTKRARIRWFTGYDKALEAKVPEDKLLNGNSNQGNTFGGAPADEEIPF